MATISPDADVNVGDRVLATDPQTGKSAAEPVTELHRNTDRELSDVTVKDQNGKASVLNTTQNHPFWNETNKKWSDAKDLRPGDELKVAGKGEVVVNKVRNYGGTKEMRDLTVDDIHTYYVIAGNEPILVHNCGGGLDANGNACGCSSRQPRADVGHVYLGGRHGGLKVDTPKGPRNPAGIEINHMPAHSSTNMPFSQGWAIQMDRADHRQLASTGGGPGSAQADYRARQKALWDSGDTAGAVTMDIDDIRLKFGTKYDGAILQMLEGIAR